MSSKVTTAMELSLIAYIVLLISCHHILLIFLCLHFKT